MNVSFMAVLMEMLWLMMESQELVHHVMEMASGA